jgi:cell division ATPase FtsA
VVKKINLEVTSITLEPIAAINVAIPKDLRMLNLALVDIGAGTSDIAITRNGSVVAYGMVPLAGDEITEVISQAFLLDFNTAEKVKLSLSAKSPEVKFTDVMGMKHTVKKEEIRSIIEPAVSELAETISERILEFNQKTTNAVFLVGGGSQIGGLTSKIAKKLLLPDERVAVRGRDIIQGISVKGKKLSGPEAITPIGIAVTAIMQQGKDFFYVNVNNRRVRLFNSRKMKVADALVMVGIKPAELIGRKGKNLCFMLNGEKKTITGEMGTSAEIMVNGTEANLQTEINPGDNINFRHAVDGKDAVLTIKDIIEYYNLQDVNIEVNGKIISSDYIICEDDKIAIEYPVKQQIKDVKTEKKMDFSDEAAAEGADNVHPGDEITVIVNKKEVKIKKEGPNSIFVDVFKYIDFDSCEVWFYLCSLKSLYLYKHSVLEYCIYHKVNILLAAVITKVKS